MPEEVTTQANLHNREVDGRSRVDQEERMGPASHLEAVLVSFPRIEDSGKRSPPHNTDWIIIMEMRSTIMLQLTHLITSGRSRKIGTISNKHLRVII